jgi:hypothetical protein
MSDLSNELTAISLTALCSFDWIKFLHYFEMFFCKQIDDPALERSWFLSFETSHVSLMQLCVLADRSIAWLSSTALPTKPKSGASPTCTHSVTNNGSAKVTEHGRFDRI